MEKYTIVYTKRTTIGSYTNVTVHITRVETKDLRCLIHKEFDGEAWFVFEGWPELEDRSLPEFFYDDTVVEYNNSEWQEEPQEEGWYFWKRRSKTQDEFFYKALYVEVNEYGTRYWENGTSITKPTGGRWKKIEG